MSKKPKEAPEEMFDGENIDRNSPTKIKRKVQQQAPPALLQFPKGDVDRLVLLLQAANFIDTGVQNPPQKFYNQNGGVETYVWNQTTTHPSPRLAPSPLHHHRFTPLPHPQFALFTQNTGSMAQQNFHNFSVSQTGGPLPGPLPFPICFPYPSAAPPLLHAPPAREYDQDLVNAELFMQFVDYLHGTPLPLDKPQAVFGKAKPAKSEKKMPAEGKRKVEKKEVQKTAVIEGCRPGAARVPNPAELQTTPNTGAPRASRYTIPGVPIIVSRPVPVRGKIIPKSVKFAPEALPAPPVLKQDSTPPIDKARAKRFAEIFKGLSEISAEKALPQNCEANAEALPSQGNLAPTAGAEDLQVLSPNTASILLRGRRAYEAVLAEEEAAAQKAAQQ